MTTRTVGTRWQRPPSLLVALVLALLMLPLAGCGVTSTSGNGTRGGGTSGCDPATQWKVPSDNANLEDMALVGSGEVWAVGAIGSGNRLPATGVIFHYVQGQTPAWQQLPQQYPGADLSAIAMDSPTDGWAASTMGLTGMESDPLVLHYTGESWRPVDIPALDAALKGPGTSGIGINWITLQMFGPNAGWLFASTNAPRDSNNPNSRSAVVILRYQGGAWTPVSAPSVADSTEMFSLSAVSADEAWIVGTDYGNNLTTLFAHYLDGAWSIWPQTFPGVTERFTMLSPSDGWAFDSSDTGTDTLLHYDGASWSTVALPSDWAANNIRLGSQVVAAGPGTRWFVLANESSHQTLVPTWQIVQYASDTWHTISMPFDDVDPVALVAVPGSSSKELVGVGNILHQEGCPPAETGTAAQGVFLRFAAGSWTRDVLP